MTLTYPRPKPENFISCFLTHLEIFGGIAQLGERMTGSHEVSGSIPLISTNFFVRSSEKLVSL